jgi:hypothetical protein
MASARFAAQQLVVRPAAGIRSLVLCSVVISG